MRLLLTVILLLSLTACVTVQTPPPAKTVIHDQAEAELLLGQHLFTDHHFFEIDSYWQKTRPGKAFIKNTPNSNRFILSGEHHFYGVDVCNPDKDFYWTGNIQLHGTITTIKAHEFTFEGSISTASNTDDDQQGLFTFSRESHPEYWSTSGLPETTHSRYPFGSVDIYVTNSLEDVFDYKKELQQIKGKCTQEGK